MERLQRWQIFKMYPEDEDLLEDVITENQQAIEMVGISANILNSVMDAFASIVSNNLERGDEISRLGDDRDEHSNDCDQFFWHECDLPFAEHPYVLFLCDPCISGISVVVVYFVYQTRLVLTVQAAGCTVIVQNCSRRVQSRSWIERNADTQTRQNSIQPGEWFLPSGRTV